MPASACPVCGATGAPELFAAEVPVRLLAPRPDAARRRFAVAGCPACGHLWNPGFTAELYDALYGDVPLTNVPVHPSMAHRLVELTDWLGEALPAGGRVVEVGGGSGHLARLLAARAGSVVVYEPCLALTKDMLPEANIRLVSAPFPAEGADTPADLVICRQVVEHLIDPLGMLRGIRASLSDGGHAYVEAPNAEYITRHAAVADLMLQHVQYFTPAGLAGLAASAGLHAVRRLDIKDGHDFGLLFRAGAPAAAAAAGALPADLSVRLSARLATARAALARLPRPFAWYGATGQTHMLAGLCGGGAVVLDDNPLNDGLVLSDGGAGLPVRRPSPEILAGLGAVVIGAYLHDLAIAERLRGLGFAGPVATARPAPLDGAPHGLAALFAGDVPA